MQKITKTLLRGVLAILPIALSLYVLVWAFKSLDSLFTRLALLILPDALAIPGLGIILGLILTYFVGVLMGATPIKKIYRFIELPFKNVPLVKSIYSAFKDLLTYFSNSDENHQSKVVLIKHPEYDMNSVGLLTNEGPFPTSKLNDKIAVYIPMSYILGGHTIFVPRDWVEEIDLNVETAMRQSLTAWIEKKSD